MPLNLRLAYDWMLGCFANIINNKSKKRCLSILFVHLICKCDSSKCTCYWRDVPTHNKRFKQWMKSNTGKRNFMLRLQNAICCLAWWDAFVRQVSKWHFSCRHRVSLSGATFALCTSAVWHFQWSVSYFVICAVTEIQTQFFNGKTSKKYLFDFLILLIHNDWKHFKLELFALFVKWAPNGYY